MKSEETISKDALRELVEEWRYEYEQPAGSTGRLEVAQAFEKCADELEEVLEDG